MSLYLLIAIALGALTGVTEVPAARPALAGVVAVTSEARARQQAIRARVPLAGNVRPSGPARRLFAFCIRRVDAPLSGAGSPRAPSHNG